MKKLILTLAAVAMAFGMMAQNVKTVPENVDVKTLDGKTVQTSVIKNDGKPIILSFWATWCKPCNKELDAISEVYEDWQAETGVKLIAVSIDDVKSSARVKPWVNGKGWEYDVYLDANQEFKRAMNVVNVPHTFVINGKGEVVWEHTSYVDGSEAELFEIVKKAMEAASEAE